MLNTEFNRLLITLGVSATILIIRKISKISYIPYDVLIIGGDSYTTYCIAELLRMRKKNVRILYTSKYDNELYITQATCDELKKLSLTSRVGLEFLQVAQDLFIINM